MKKGDVVTIRDNSYTQSIINGKLIHESLAYGEEQGKKYIVIEIGCKFPVLDYYQGSIGTPSFNNTVIQAIDSGKVVFIEERFLKLVPPKHKVMVDIKYQKSCLMSGNVFEISDKLYQEIKREPLIRCSRG